MSTSRRLFLRWSTTFTLAAPAVLGAAQTSNAAHAAVEAAHKEIWRRFMDKHDVMLDFTGLEGAVILPMPEECRLGKSNALGWWSPIENGGFAPVNVSPDETWVVSSEMAFPKERQSEPNRVPLARIIWTQANKLFAAGNEPARPASRRTTS